MCALRRENARNTGQRLAAPAQHTEYTGLAFIQMRFDFGRIAPTPKQKLRSSTMPAASRAAAYFVIHAGKRQCRGVG